MLRMTFLLIILKAYQEDAATPSMTIKQMIRSYGYPVEEHKHIRTEDGYLLTMHRIPYGAVNKVRERRPAIFLMHGLLSSAIDWINMGPGFSIAYDLAEAGFDVWMGNARGNKFSKLHERLHPILNRATFWGFSWHEIGRYDLPAMIDFILTITNRKRLYYIGHSQGTTSFFVMASLRPKYNKKIRLMIALAPVVYMDHIQNPFIQMLARVNDPINAILNIFGWHEFLPGDELFNLIGRKLCSTLATVKAMCASAFFMVCGFDSQQLNRSAIPMIIANVPAGAATRQFIHYAQVITSKRFQQFDFGAMQNIVKYSSIDPPTYKLSNVNVPISLVYAENDWLSSPRDVKRLRDKLSNVVDIYKVPFSKFNHLDYLFAIDVKKLVNDHVLQTLRKFHKKGLPINYRMTNNY